MMSKIQIIVSLELENIDLLAASELDSTRKLIVEFEWAGQAGFHTGRIFCENSQSNVSNMCC